MLDASLPLLAAALSGGPLAQGGAPALSRRAMLGAGVGALFSAATPLAGSAAANAKDLSRLPAGLKEINYLLDNWAKETTNPISGDADPDRVRLFVGLRTTTSPLFQVRLRATARPSRGPCARSAPRGQPVAATARAQATKIDQK
jgi:hypothetical protein